MLKFGVVLQFKVPDHEMLGRNKRRWFVNPFIIKLHPSQFAVYTSMRRTVHNTTVVS